MANAMYDKGRRRFLEGAINWLNDSIKVALVDTGMYPLDLANDEFLGIIPLAARLRISTALTGKSTGSGVADAADILFTGGIATQASALVLFKDTGDPSTSPLIAFIDTATGLPVPATPSTINVKWDDSVNRIFKL